ncbi:MAG: hypothetical protein PHX90_08060, partial [Thermotogota bacterium]|nr:hypothetical protein [Thermotogota bacterium]
NGVYKTSAAYRKSRTGVGRYSAGRKAFSDLTGYLFRFLIVFPYRYDGISLLLRYNRNVSNLVKTGRNRVSNEKIACNAAGPEKV